jgi:hypothetical protein
MMLGVHGDLHAGMEPAVRSARVESATIGDAPKTPPGAAEV